MQKKTRTRENPAIRRAQIVDEGIKIIGERGYNGFTIQALAERCGMSNAGLLHYFESKDALLLSLLDEIERREIDMVASQFSDAFAALESGASPQPIVEHVLNTIMGNFIVHPEIARFITVLFAEAIDEGHPAHDWVKLAEQETTALLTRLLGFVGQNEVAEVRRLYAHMRGLQLFWVRPGQEFDIMAEWRATVRALLKFDEMGQSV